MLVPQSLDDGRSPGLRMHLQAKPTLLADLLRKLLEVSGAYIHRPSAIAEAIAA